MADEDKAVPKPKRAWRIPAATLLVGAALGGGGGFFGSQLLASGHGETTEAATEDRNCAPAEGSENAEHGAAGAATTNAVTSIGSFTVNLRGSGGGRLLRLEVSFEGRPTDAQAINDRQAQLRDSIIAAVSDYSWNELEGAAGKTRLRDELLRRANGVVSPSTIDRIYFTQFVVQ